MSNVKVNLELLVGRIEKWMADDIGIKNLSLDSGDEVHAVLVKILATEGLSKESAKSYIPYVGNYLNSVQTYRVTVFDHGEEFKKACAVLARFSN